MTNDELFGIINPATREWKDGLFSVLMRDQANLVGDNPKWIVLDGWSKLIDCSIQNLLTSLCIYNRRHRPDVD